MDVGDPIELDGQRSITWWLRSRTESGLTKKQLTSLEAEELDESCRTWFAGSGEPGCGRRPRGSRGGTRGATWHTCWSWCPSTWTWRRRNGVSHLVVGDDDDEDRAIVPEKRGSTPALLRSIHGQGRRSPRSNTEGTT